MSTTERILKALWSPRDTAVQKLVDLGQSLDEQLHTLRESQQKAYDDGQNLKGFAMNGSIGARSLAKSAVESTAEAVASLEIGGGSSKVDEKGGVGGLFNTTSRNNVHDYINLPEPTKKSAAEMESGDDAGIRVEPHDTGSLLNVARRSIFADPESLRELSAPKPTPNINEDEEVSSAGIKHN
jgi:hypothetical protein